VKFFSGDECWNHNANAGAIKKSPVNVFVCRIKTRDQQIDRLLEKLLALQSQQLPDLGLRPWGGLSTKVSRFCILFWE
jgi:hypothetical protein